ncbi:MAG: hypothetical protein U9N56_06300, partial [Actinomycetota bacterium]|nr:hypothetical protein [Actinomycetota bacterium]
MKLAVLLHEIEKSPGPVTGLDLAKRLDLTPAEVMAMISALRAAGKLTPEGPMAEEHCPTAASCSLSCPG